MRVISKKALHNFYLSHADAKPVLLAWYKKAKGADWADPQAVKRDYPHASILADNRVCFNIGGNKYRLIVKINYPYRVVYIRFVGTHAMYDKIEANTV